MYRGGVWWSYLDAICEVGVVGGPEGMCVLLRA